MRFNLKKEIVFFDIESTGLNILRDRILQIALIKYFPGDKEPEELEMLINPGLVLISEEAQRIHGISSKDVANKPTFDQVAKKLYDFIGDADLGGYNSNRFDIPMLMEEFNRVGIDFRIENRNLIDMQRLFYKMEPRTLSAAHKYYTGEKMENAHDALADVRATVNVLKGQLKMYENTDFEDADGNVTEKPVKNDMQAIHAFTNDLNIIDTTMRIKYNENGEIVFNFGKYSGQKVIDVIRKDRNYYHWILDKDFSIQVKRVVKNLMDDFLKNAAT